MWNFKFSPHFANKNIQLCETNSSLIGFKFCQSDIAARVVWIHCLFARTKPSGNISDPWGTITKSPYKVIPTNPHLPSPYTTSAAWVFRLIIIFPFFFWYSKTYPHLVINARENSQHTYLTRAIVLSHLKLWNNK